MGLEDLQQHINFWNLIPVLAMLGGIIVKAILDIRKGASRKLTLLVVFLAFIPAVFSVYKTASIEKAKDVLVRQTKSYHDNMIALLSMFNINNVDSRDLIDGIDAENSDAAIKRLHDRIFRMVMISVQSPGQMTSLLQPE